MTSLYLDEPQREMMRSLERFCELHAAVALASEAQGVLPETAWRKLAAMGVLGLGSAESGMGVLSVATAMHVFGRANFPGPLVSTFIAGRLLKGDDLAHLSDGSLVVAAGTPPLVAWACAAQRIIVVDSGRARAGRPRQPVTPVATLGGEPWGLVTLEATDDLGDATAACAVGDVAQAAYLAGAGSRLVGLACEHARTRTQFGRSIGEFQGVAHPLAVAEVHLRAAWTLALGAAAALDAAEPGFSALAAAARLSAQRAALDAASRGHQTFGALGVLIEGPVFAFSRRIRQWASAPVDTERAHQAVLASFSRSREERP